MNPLTRRGWMGSLVRPALGASLVPAWAAAGAADAGLAGVPVHDVRRYGARGDGTTLDTAAVQAAIDACAGEQGGTVLVPAGDFVVGTLELKSHVTLHLAPKGRLLGSSDPTHYAAGHGVPESNGNVVLLYAANAENVTIEGRGTIDGQGAKFFTGRGDNTGPGQDSSHGYFQRPHLLVFYRCRNLLVRDVFLTASAYHCMRVLECERVHLFGIRIHNRVNKNNDGFHVVGSRYVQIADCNVECQDDACALFGSNRYVTVANSTFSTRWSVFRFGGGEAQDIAIANCVIYETYGCPIKIRVGAGARIENVSFADLVMRDVTGPISVGLDSTPRPRPGAPPPDPSRPPGVVRNLRFSGIRATVVAQGRQHADLPFPSEFRPGETRTCIVLNGVGSEYLEEIALEDVHATFGGGGTAEEARREVPPTAGEYFEIGTPPAYGLYARNVRGLTVRDVRLRVAAPDLRPAVVLDHVEDASLSGLAAQGDPSAESVVRVRDSRDVLFAASRVLTPAAAFVRVEGGGSANVVLDGGDLSKAASAATLGAGAAKAQVRVRT